IPAEDYPILNNYLGLFEKEINKYPRGFFIKKEIRAIALVERLFREETPADGIYSPQSRVMLFDIIRSQENPSFERHNIHHEIFHMMALQPPTSESLSVANWRILNLTGFVYGHQTKPLSERNPVNLYAPNQLGFVTDYAM